MLIQGHSGQAMATNPDIITGHEFQGEACAICLAQQDANSIAVWNLFIDVHLDQGWFRLGWIVCNTPAVDSAPARVVGYASCPGAKAFRVQAWCTTEGEIADLVIVGGKCCGGGGAFGVTLPPGGNTGPQPPPH